MKQAWVPYPAYTDRAAWDSLMGPNKQRLIEAGEKLLSYKWQLIPATAYLEYERSGNRKVMEVPYDDNRRALNTLMLLSWLKFYRYLFPVRACVRGYSRVSDPFSYGHLQFKNRIGLSAGFDKNARSEERRVGKECRSRWSPYH